MESVRNICIIIYKEVDAALIRKGRMDKHREVRTVIYIVNFESFKVLARNYLKLESQSVSHNM